MATASETLYEPTPEVENRLHSLERRFRKEAADPLAGDIRIGAFFGAISRKVRERADIRGTMLDMLAMRPHILPYVAAPLIQKTFQRPIMKRSDYSDYLEDHTTSYRWGETIDDIYDEKGEAWEQINADLVSPNVEVSANEPERAKGLGGLLFPWLHSIGRLTDKPTGLEIGCSRNLIFKKLALARQEEFRFRPATVYKPESKHKPGTNHVVVDEVSTGKIEELIKDPYTIKLGMGIDTWPILEDAQVKERARSHTFRTSQLVNERDRVEEWDNLDASDPPNVVYQDINLLDPESTGFLRDSDRRLMDLDFVLFSTMLYQRTSEEQAQLIEVAKRYVKPEGFIIIQDHAKVDPRKPTHPEYYEWWTPPWRYRTSVIDMREPGKFQELFIWDGPQCKKLQLGLGTICVEGGLRSSFRDFLEEQ